MGMLLLFRHSRKRNLIRGNSAWRLSQHDRSSRGVVIRLALVEKLAQQVWPFVLKLCNMVVLVLDAFVGSLAKLCEDAFVSNFLSIAASRTILNLISVIFLVFPVIENLALHELMTNLECLVDASSFNGFVDSGNPIDFDCDVLHFLRP